MNKSRILLTDEYLAVILSLIVVVLISGILYYYLSMII